MCIRDRSDSASRQPVPGQRLQGSVSSGVGGLPGLPPEGCRKKDRGVLGGNIMLLSEREYAHAADILAGHTEKEPLLKELGGWFKDTFGMEVYDYFCGFFCYS